MSDPPFHHLFPPREDVRVADVYLRRLDVGSESSAERAGDLPIDLWVSSLDARQAIVPCEPAAFPSLGLMSIQGSDLAGLVPVEALALAFGANWKGQHQIQVTIPSVEFSRVPAADLITAAAGPDARLCRRLATDLQTWLEGGGVRRVGAQPALSDAEREGLAQRSVLGLELIFEVFYAREIEIDISTAVVRGAGLAAAAEDTPVALARQLNARLEKVGVETPSGDSFRFLAASTLGVSMVRTFAHNTAVGYRSVPVQVEPRSSRLLADSPSARDLTA